MNRLSATTAAVLAAAVFTAGIFTAAAAGMTEAEAQKHLRRTFSNVEVSAVKPAEVPGVYEVTSEGSVYYLSGDGAYMLAGARFPLDSKPELEKSVRAGALAATAMPGVYQTVSEGSVYYLSKDGAFALSGVLYDLKADVNLTESIYNEMRLDAVAQITDDRVIVYSPEQPRYTVNVFSDPDCPYCQKFHSQIEEYKKLGIRVRYLLTPLLGPQARAQAIGVWCSKDRRAALDRAKRKQPVEAGDCKHPIDKNLALARLVGVYATPALLLENGKLVSGYRAPGELLHLLKREGAQSRS